MKDKDLQESSQSDENDDHQVAKRSSISAVHSFDRDFKVFEKEPRSTQLVFSYQGGKKVPRLKEPRNLYAFSSTEKGLQSLPRWPAQMKIVPIRPNHIEYVPRNPEPFVKTDRTDEDADLCKVSYEEGRVVYDNPHGPEKYFMRSRVGGCPVNKWPYHKVKSPDDCTLVFESRFECGNLSRAIKVPQSNEYQLWLSHDLYTNKHTQWFYFRVQNTMPGVRYKFTIMNLLKSGSLYNEGMRPLLYSELDATKKKIGWVRTGDNIKYYKNSIKREDTTKEKYHCSLTWTCEFHNVDDTYYFAHCYPYTYSDLQEYLQNLRSDPVRSKICKQRVLCRTLAGNFVYILTVTNPSRRPADAEAKQGVVLTARVHPGETNSSWMMKGLLDYLTSSAPDAKILRDTFVFKVIPMLNPDGVIIGNYRCSLAGRDLNRNYKTVLKDSFPPIWHVRNMVRKLMEEREITLYCDLHGHSRKQNVFIYGCENRSDPLKRLRERVFPVMMSRNAPSKFSFKGCKFKVQKSKEGTGRVVMWNMGILNSFTMEATFCGSSLGERAGYHFNTADFESMGFHLCDSLLDYCDPDNSKYVTIVRELELQLKSDILEKMKRKGTGADNLTVSDIDLEINYTSDIESSTSGSDSSESDGLPMHLIYAPEGLQMIKEKKKKLKSRKERNKRRAKAMKIKSVLLTDADKYSVQQQPELPAEMKLMYQKNHAKRSSQPSPARFKVENPVVHKHEHKPSSRSSTPSFRLGSTRLDSSCRHDYLEAITNAYMMSGVLVTESSEVPHFRYTAGTAYLKETQPSDRTASMSRWSTASPGPTQKFDISDEEGHFTVAYLAKQFERKADCTNVFPRSRTEKRVSSALELARKITKYNNRHKTTGITAQETELQAAPAPILVPRTPVQPYPYHPWQPSGDCLSSTKARLYEQPNPLKEHDLRKSVSHMSLVDKKGNKSTVLKNSPGKTVTSAAATEQTSRTRADVPVLTKKRQVQQRDVEAEAKADSQGPKNVSVRSVQPQRLLDSHPQTQTKVAPRPMKKYTGSAQAGLTPSGIERVKPAVSMTTPTTTTSFLSNTRVLNGRQSPVYVAVPVDRPPVKVKPSSSGKGTTDISTISELRSKLLNDLDSGNLVSCGLQSMEDDVQPVLSNNGSKKHSFAATRKKRHEPNSVTMTTGVPSWQEEGISQAGFVTGVVQVGNALGDWHVADDYKGPARPHQSPISPPRNQESGAAPSTISLTFKFDPSISSREPSGSTQQRQSALPPQLKSPFRPHWPHHK